MPRKRFVKTIKIQLLKPQLNRFSSFNRIKTNLFNKLTNIRNFFTRILKKFTCSYILRLLMGSIIFKSLLYALRLYLVYMGVSDAYCSYMIAALVLLLILYSCLKAKNKIEHAFTLCIKITLICLFWYALNQICNVDTLCLFLGSYILIGFDDFDLSELVESVLGELFHNKGIGDPVGPGGGPGGGPNYPLLFYMNEDIGDGEVRRYSYNDPEKIFHNNPLLDNYKKFLIGKDGVSHDVSSIRNYIAECNSKVLPTEPNQLTFQKEEIKNFLEMQGQCLAERGNDDTPLQFYKDLQISLHEYMLEYNTLTKAKLHYEEPTESGEDCKKAFEIWQKRHISMDCHRYIDVDSSTPFSHIPDWYDHSQVYTEIRDNLLWAQLELIDCKIKYDAIRNNMSILTEDKSKFDEFDDFVTSVQKSGSYPLKFWSAHEFIDHYAVERLDVPHMTKEMVGDFYELVPMLQKHIENLMIEDKEFAKEQSQALTKWNTTFKPDLRLYKGITKDTYHAYNQKVGLGLADKFFKPKFSLINPKYYGKVGLGLAEKFSKPKFSWSDYMMRQDL